MKVDVVLLPKHLADAHVRNRAVVVFDVLRATTTMTAALASGAEQIQVFPNLDDARAAAHAHSGARLLCGEVRCLAPEGFDLGNSPGAYVQDVVRGKTLFMSTTNGTRAIAAARGASRLYVGALVNATAVAQAAGQSGLDLTLLCAGTDGEMAMEDVLGAGAVIDAIRKDSTVELHTDAAVIAVTLFDRCRDSLGGVLNETTGARNVIAAGLEADVKFAARLDLFDIVGEVDPNSLTVRPHMK